MAISIATFNATKKGRHVALVGKGVTYDTGGLNIKVSLPESRRKALSEGTWDSTGLLVANADKVKENAKKLPYMSAYS